VTGPVAVMNAVARVRSVVFMRIKTTAEVVC